MASTNKTTNYELSQFEGTDKPSWEADYNADMLIIDTNMKAISDVANGASGDISTLDGRMTTAEGDISTNANDIDALEGRADALEAGQTSDDSRLDALEAEQIVQNTAIESNTRLGYNLARPYDSASTYAVGAYVLFQDTLYKCTTAVSTGEAFDPNKWLAIKATDEIAAGGATGVLYTENEMIVSSTHSNGTVTNISIPRYQRIALNNLNIINLTLSFTFSINSTDDNIRFILNWRNTPIPLNDGTTRLLLSALGISSTVGNSGGYVRYSFIEINTGTPVYGNNIMVNLQDITPNTPTTFNVNLSFAYLSNE